MVSCDAISTSVVPSANVTAPAILGAVSVVIVAEVIVAISLLAPNTTALLAVAVPAVTPFNTANSAADKSFRSYAFDTVIIWTAFCENK